MKRIAALIMAAGASARFGGCKLLADVHERTLLQQSIDLASEVLPNDVYVVSGAWHRELLDAKNNGQLEGASFVYAESWSDGLAASLATGIRHLESDYDAILVLLADQVALVRADLVRLLDSFDGNNITCGFYNDQRGVPAIFPGKSFDRLKELSGDRGAKKVLYESVVPVRECPMPNASLDIDNRNQLMDWNGRR